MQGSLKARSHVCGSGGSRLVFGFRSDRATCGPLVFTSEQGEERNDRKIEQLPTTDLVAFHKELALHQLETGLRAPVASLSLSYGALKLLPFWDPLRGDPRFEQIVALLAPKESAAAAK